MVCYSPRHNGGDVTGDGKSVSGSGSGARHAGVPVGFIAGLVHRVLPASPVVMLAAAMSVTGVASAQQQDGVLLADNASGVRAASTVPAASRSFVREALVSVGAVTVGSGSMVSTQNSDSDDNNGDALDDSKTASVSVDADSDWGGIESLSIQYSQSTAEREALGKLDEAIKTAEQTHEDSDGKVTDESKSKRDELSTEIDSAKTVSASKTKASSEYDDARSKLESKTDAVKQAVTVWQQIQDAQKNSSDSDAVTTAAGDAARTAAQMASAGSTGNGSELDASTIKAPNGKTGDDLASYAVQFAGKVPYVWGGTSTQGWDCSGFVQYVYKQYGVSLPRVAASQATVGRAVSLSEAKPGDIVANSTHAAIYIGNGMVVNALNPSEGTKITSLSVFYGGYSIRRVLG